MAIKVRNIVDVIEIVAPIHTMEEWDNSGLNIGDLDSDIKGILLTLEVTMDVLKEAVEKECNLIISHHPMLFSKFNNITTSTILGEKIFFAIKNNLNLYSSHTNLDKAEGGMSDEVMKVLGFDDFRRNDPPNNDYGRIATIGKIKYKDLLETISTKLNANVRFTGNLEDEVSEIAVINGSGGDLIEDIIKSDAEVIITGDLKYHEMMNYEERNLKVVDAGHFNTENQVFLNVLTTVLSKTIKENNIPIYYSDSNKDPFKYLD